VPYQVQYATDLINSNWIDPGSVVTSTGNSDTVYDTSLPGLRTIYQVLSIQQERCARARGRLIAD